MNKDLFNNSYKVMYFINRKNFDKLLNSIAKFYNVYAPVKIDGERYYKKVGEDSIEDYVIGEIRAVFPIKAFYFPIRTKVSEYFSDYVSEEEAKPIVIIGAKACDLASLKIMDYVFREVSVRDTSYITQREQGIILSSDCTFYGETCFCVGLDIMPYPVGNFDLNLSEIENGYVVEVGSEKGEKIIKDYSNLFQNPNIYIEKKETNRRRLRLELLAYVQQQKMPAKDLLPSLFKKRFDSTLWEETAKTCVECGACNMICPACHCFVLMDQYNKGKDIYERLRLWDSCLLLSYAMVSGGANPRKLLSERLRNRFDKKFNFFPSTIGRFGCTGCGRCIEACPGKIDIRKVLSKFG